MSVNINQLGVPTTQSVMAADDARLQTVLPVPPANTGIAIVGPAGALSNNNINRPANGDARYLKINYNGTELWALCKMTAP